MKTAATVVGVALIWAVGAVARGAEPVEITLVSQAGSPWTLDVSAETSTVVARHAERPDLALEIDCDDEADDERLSGIAPVLGEERLEGEFWGRKAPFFYPILVPGEHALERVRIEPGGESLRVRFEGGSYALLQPAAGPDPLWAEMVFALEGDDLIVHLAGLYYLLPSQEGTRLRITSTEGESVRRVDRPAADEPTVVRDAVAELGRLDPAGGQHLEYFEEVERVELENPRFGDMELVAWIERLQIQVDRSPGADSDLFELDFDHAFKDRGQRSILARLRMSLGEEPPSRVPSETDTNE